MSAAPDRLSPEFRVRVADADLPSEAVADLRRVSVTQDVEAPGVFALATKTKRIRKKNPLAGIDVPAVEK